MTESVSKRLVRAAKGYRVNPSVTDVAIERILSGLDCPRSLAVWILYNNKEHQQLVDLDFQADHYPDVGSARDAYLATQLLSKSDFLKLDLDRRQVALQKFITCEDKCRTTNRRFVNLALDPQFTGPNVWLLNATRRKIASILNGRNLERSSSFCPEEWFDSCSWGPGSSTRVTGRDTSPTNKFQSDSGITKDLYALIGPLFNLAYPLWGEALKNQYPDWGTDGLLASDFLFEKGNKVLTVPKNAKTDRVIAAEPGLNVWFQLGLGRMISRRLLRNAGIDLRDQSRNGLLAFYASLANNLATVDFSSASDTISTEVVRELLPSDWFSVLDSCRSRFGRVELNDGPRVVEYNKFSSMGNGYTFPLQSLIFTGVALAVCEFLNLPDDYVGVFGDDVIIPNEAFGLFDSFCSFLGFTIGREKSFFSGFFRESCGAHYYRGVDLKPFFIKERLKNVESIYILANNIRRFAHRCSYYGCDRRMRSAWTFLLRKVPKILRIFTPEGYGDGGFIGNFDESSPSTVRRPEGLYVEGYSVGVVTQTPVRRKRSNNALLLARLYDMGVEAFASQVGVQREISGQGNLVPLRQATRRRFSFILVHEWYSFGQWI